MPTHLGRAVTVLAATLLLPACKPPAPQAPPARLTNVETWIVEPADLIEEVVLPGLVEAQTSVRVSAEVAAPVRRRAVSEGEYVARGQVLLELDGTDLSLMHVAAEAQVASLEQRVREVKKGSREQQVREAQAAMDAAGAALELARKVARHREELFKEKVIPEEMLDQARFQVAQAQAGYDRTVEVLALVKEGALEETRKALEAQLDAAKAQAMLASNQFQKTIVRSPIEGYVQKCFIEAHEFAGPGSPLFDVIARSPVKIVLGVPERIFTRLRETDPVSVRFQALDVELDAKISHTAFAADQRTQTFQVEIRLDSPVKTGGPDPATMREILLRPGLIADVKLTTGVRRGAIAIPNNAVVLDGSILYAFVTERDAKDPTRVVARAKPVLLGMKKDGLLEVTQGLAVGERLVTKGQRYLKDGDPVNVVGEKKGPVAQFAGMDAATQTPGK